MLAKGFSKPTDRVERLRSMIVDAVPCIEAERAVLITESYQATEGLPMIMRRAKALENILNNLTVTIRDDELVVGTLTKAVRSCQLFPENSYKWVMDEFDTIETRMADPFKISEEDKATLRKVLPYWEDKTISDLASSYMSEKTKECIANGVFTVGNYFFGGVGHIIIDYDKAIRRGYKAIIQDAVEASTATTLTSFRKHSSARLLSPYCLLLSTLQNVTLTKQKRWLLLRQTQQERLNYFRLPQTVKRFLQMVLQTSMKLVSLSSSHR